MYGAFRDFRCPPSYLVFKTLVESQELSGPNPDSRSDVRSVMDSTLNKVPCLNSSYLQRISLAILWIIILLVNTSTYTSLLFSLSTKF